MNLADLIDKWLKESRKLSHYYVLYGWFPGQEVEKTFGIVCRCSRHANIFIISDNYVESSLMSPRVKIEASDLDFFTRLKDRLTKDHDLYWGNSRHK